MEIEAKNQIRAAERRLLEAMKKSDIAELDVLLHDDLLFAIPTGQTVTKEMDLLNLRSGNLKISEISASEQDISLFDGNAVVSVIVELKGSFLDQPIDGQFKYIRTWKKFGDRWKVIGGAGIQL